MEGTELAYFEKVDEIITKQFSSAPSKTPKEFLTELNKVRTSCEKLQQTVAKISEEKLKEKRLKSHRNAEDQKLAEKAKILEINKKMAETTCKFAIFLEEKYCKLSPDMIEKHSPALCKTLTNLEKLIKLAEYRLYWQTDIPLPCSKSIKRWFKKRHRKIQNFFEKNSDFLIDVGGFTGGLFILGCLMTFILIPWCAVISAGALVIFLGCLGLKKLFSKKNPNNSLWNPALLQEIQKLMEDLSNEELDQKRLQAALPFQLEGLLKGVETLHAHLIYTRKCDICLDQMNDNDRRPMCFNAQGCRHIVCYECGSEMLKKGHKQCHQCRRPFDRLMEVCIKCHLKAIQHWKCKNSHIVCAVCAVDSPECPSCSSNLENKHF